MAENTRDGDSAAQEQPPTDTPGISGIIRNTSASPLDPRAVLDAALPDDQEWDERELVQLGVLERQAGHIAKLEEELTKHGYVDLGSKGQLRVSPLVSELRLQYAAMARVAEAIRLPDEQAKPKSVRHQRAANQRWGRKEQ